MHRLALIAAALLPLASGCVSSMDPPPPPLVDGSATIYWRFQAWDFQLAGDYTSLNSGCVLAGVQEVDLDVRDAANRSVYYQSHFCQASNGVPGAVVALPPGSYSYLATAYRGHDHFTAVPVYSSGGTFAVAGGLDTPEDATLDWIAPQPLLVLYSKNGQVTCSGVGGVYYSVSDPLGHLETRNVACDPYNELTVGNASVMGTTYTFDWLQLLDGNGFSTHEVCAWPVFHNGFAAIVDLPAVPPGASACGF
jgi:hypothetical protein